MLDYFLFGIFQEFSRKLFLIILRTFFVLSFFRLSYLSVFMHPCNYNNINLKYQRNFFISIPFIIDCVIFKTNEHEERKKTKEKFSGIVRNKKL